MSQCAPHGLLLSCCSVWGTNLPCREVTVLGRCDLDRAYLWGENTVWSGCQRQWRISGSLFTCCPCLRLLRNKNGSSWGGTSSLIPLTPLQERKAFPSPLLCDQPGNKTPHEMAFSTSDLIFETEERSVTQAVYRENKQCEGERTLTLVYYASYMQ